MMRLGLYSALTSVLTLPVVSVLPALLTPRAHAEAPRRADIGETDGSPSNPLQQFMSFQESLHERVFGYPRTQQDDIVYRVLDPVTGPGVYFGHNTQNDLFLFSIDLFETMENPVDEVFPGVTATAINIVHGVVYGLEAVEVYALVTTMQFEGETQQRLLALFEVDSTFEGAWASLYEFFALPPVESVSGCQAGGCQYYCDKRYCADGTQFCSLCDPLLCEAVQDFYQELRHCRDKFGMPSTWTQIGLIVGISITAIGCSFATGGLCLLGISGVIVALAAIEIDVNAAVDQCQDDFSHSVDVLYEGFCAEHGGPAEN
jgi:hypothetical protein